MSFSSDPIGQLFFSLESPTTSQAVCAVLVLDTEPDIALLRRKLAQMAERFRKLKSRWNGSRWNACPFDVDEHFFVHRLQSNTTEETLEDVSSCYSEPLDFSKSPWRAELFIPRAPAKPLWTFTIHHGLCDGLSAFHMIGTLQNATSELSETLNISGNEDETLFSQEPCGGEQFSTWASLRRWLKELIVPREHSALDGENSRARTLRLVDLDLKAIRKLTKETDTSLYEVVLAITGVAITGYLQARGAHTKTLRVVVPVSYRSRQEKYRVRNLIAGVGFELPVRNVTPREYLQDVSKRFSALKRSGGLGAYLIAGRLAGFAPRFIQRIACRLQSRRTNFIVTHLPAAGRTRYLAGAKVLSFYGTPALWHSHGLGLGYVNYAGKLCVVLSADPAIVKDVDGIAADIAHAAEKFYQSASLPLAASPAL